MGCHLRGAYGSSIRETFNVTHSRLLPQFFGQARGSSSSLNVRMETSSESQSAGQTSYPLINSWVPPGISQGYAASNPSACACAVPPRRLRRPDPKPLALRNTPAASSWSGRPGRRSPGADATPSRDTDRPARNTPRRMSSTLSVPVSIRPLPPLMPLRSHAASCQKRPPRPNCARRCADIENFPVLHACRWLDQRGCPVQKSPTGTRRTSKQEGTGYLFALVAWQGATISRSRSVPGQAPVVRAERG